MTKEIPLTQGKVALVDDEDFEFINQFKWCCSSKGYAVRNFPIGFGKRKTILMHKEIIQTPNGQETDHINMNKLDNRRENLRICTASHNRANSKLYRNNNSGFKGVWWHKKGGKWEAGIGVGYRSIYLGLFDDPKKAAHAYDEAAKKYFGEFANTNLKEESNVA